MSFKTTPEHELFRSKVRDFAETEVKPIAFMLDQENQFPDEIVFHMRDLGLMGILTLKNMAAPASI
jgi:butyryl-CoA dehydrogenase